MKHDREGPSAFADAAAALGVDLPDGAALRLEEYEAMLAERGIPQGLVARSDAGRIRERHILDSLRALTAIGDRDALAYDVGSGAGLPGVVVAVARPSLVVRLVEPRRARAAFLEWVLETLDVTNAEVVQGRIENQRTQADACLARAFAPLPDAWLACRHVLRSGGRLVYFAGKASDDPALLDGATRVDVLGSALLACSGPLIIMTR